jgi:hypothetical protein
MMLLIPHPYEDGMAEKWIASLRPSYEAGSTLPSPWCCGREVNSSVASG